MKQVLGLLFLVFSFGDVEAAWRQLQLDSANTEKQNPRLTEAEKQVVLYINLCRLYPKQFVEEEVRKYQLPQGFHDDELLNYKASLIKNLQTKKPVPALRFEERLFNDAACYAGEIAKHDLPPHERITCPPIRCAECVSFGFSEGRQIALQLLIDSGVPSLGHRNICLGERYTSLGLRISEHFEYGFCCVINFC